MCVVVVVCVFKFVFSSPNSWLCISVVDMCVLVVLSCSNSWLCASLLLMWVFWLCWVVPSHAAVHLCCWCVCSGRVQLFQLMTLYISVADVCVLVVLSCPKSSHCASLLLMCVFWSCSVVLAHDSVHLCCWCVCSGCVELSQVVTLCISVADVCSCCVELSQLMTTSLLLMCVFWLHLGCWCVCSGCVELSQLMTASLLLMCVFWLCWVVPSHDTVHFCCWCVCSGCVELSQVMTLCISVADVCVLVVLSCPS